MSYFLSGGAVDPGTSCQLWYPSDAKKDIRFYFAGQSHNHGASVVTEEQRILLARVGSISSIQ